MNPYLQLYADIGGSLPGSDRQIMRIARQAALTRFATDGFPTPREEEWKYTNITPIEKKLFKPLAALPTADEPALDPAVLAGLQLADAWRIVLVDGQFRPDLSDLTDLPGGLIVESARDSLLAGSERVESMIGRSLDREAHALIAFNGAFFNDGAVIDVPSELDIERPIQILHIATRDDAALICRNLIKLGTGSRLKVFESFASPNRAGYLTAAVTEAAVGKHASLDYYRLQTESDKAYHFGGLYVRQELESRFRHHTTDFGGLLARGEVHTELGEGAECILDGLFLAKGRQHVDNHTRIQHRRPHGSSSENYRGIISDRAHGVFQGRIVVHPRAQKTQADMNNRNLLLSADAEIDTKPQLEILADDVKCSHGVTVGQLDPESVFYLQSRGVDTESARNMLTFAFAKEMVEKIELPELRAIVQQHLLNLFPQTGIRRDWL